MTLSWPNGNHAKTLNRPLQFSNVAHGSWETGSTSAAQRINGERALPCNDDSWAWLLHHREGRLGYHTGRGDRSVVVRYAVAGHQILVRLPDYNDIVHYAPGEQVRLDVDGKVPTIDEWVTVSVRGMAELANNDQLPAEPDSLFDEPWTNGVKLSIVCIPVTELELIVRPQSR
jgi:hypothetical protein